MPELPEVETVCRDLRDVIVGERITHVDVYGARSIRSHASADEFTRALVEATPVAVTRRAKFIVIALDTDATLIVHLGMSGQLLWCAQGAPHPKHTHVAVQFANGSALLFVDPRTFGQMVVVSDGGAARFANYGVEPLDPTFDVRALESQLATRSMRMKTLLMDQRVVVGIGNIYSDEILHASRLRWDRRAQTLDAADVERLHGAIVDVLNRAIRARGSSLRDAQYVDLSGRTGNFAEQHAVYDRAGEPCPRCRTPIERVRTAGRSTFFCPACAQ